MQRRYYLEETAVAFLLVVVASIVLFILLLPVPRDFVKAMPEGLACEFYAASRRGWDCARWGDVTEQPAIALFALFTCVFVFVWIWRRSSNYAPALFIVAGPLWLFLGAAALTRTAYFILGSATKEYLLWTIPIAILSFIAWKIISMPKSGPRSLDFGILRTHMRYDDRTFQDGIDLEIAERKNEAAQTDKNREI